jgi:hypothetical protein
MHSPVAKPESALWLATEWVTGVGFKEGTAILSSSHIETRLWDQSSGVRRSQRDGNCWTPYSTEVRMHEVVSSRLHMHLQWDSIALLIIVKINVKHVNWGSSVSIVSDYRLDDQGLIPGRGKYFYSSLCVQTGWGPPSFLSNGYRGSFPGVKARLGRDADHSPPLVPRSRRSRSYTSCPFGACMAIAGRLYFFNYFLKWKT